MTTKEKIVVMQAYEDGKKIQWLIKGEYEDNWKDISPSREPIWNWPECDYRIKPEPKYVPYDSVSEVKKHKWVLHKGNKVLYRIIAIDSKDSTVQLAIGWFNLKELFEYYTYEDGTPCGKLVE